MAKKKSTRPRTKTDTVSADDLGHLKAATELLGNAIQSLRIAAALFDQEGEPTASAA